METNTQLIESEANATLEFNAGLERWLKGAQAKVDEGMKRYTMLQREVLVVDRLDKMVRIWKRPENAPPGNRGSAYAFIALVDNDTKALGHVRRGDVMKSASWKVPAKHARGNIFDADNGLNCTGEYGIAYLR
jgi:hypothetical protein